MQRDEIKTLIRKMDEMLTLMRVYFKIEVTEMAALDDQIQGLTDEVSRNTDVNASALRLMQRIPELIQAAVDQALQQGATPQQLQAITDLKTKLGNNDNELAAAVTASTPAA